MTNYIQFHCPFFSFLLCSGSSCSESEKMKKKKKKKKKEMAKTHSLTHSLTETLRHTHTHSFTNWVKIKKKYYHYY